MEVVNFYNESETMMKGGRSVSRVEISDMRHLLDIGLKCFVRRKFN